MKSQTFTEFLEERYDEIDNDSNNCNEAFEGRRDTWFAELDPQEVIDYAEDWNQQENIASWFIKNRYWNRDQILNFFRFVQTTVGYALTVQAG